MIRWILAITIYKILLDVLTSIQLLERSLEVITFWLTRSGLKVNSSKTELCHFSRRDHQPLSLPLNGEIITTSPTINVLGVIFDSKLQWGPQVAAAYTRASRALSAISLIRRFFNQQELLQLVTSNYYSILFYNSEVWHLNTLNQSLKNSLLSISAKALKICAKSSDVWMLSYPNLHEMAGRATPDKIMSYKLALQLYRTFNDESPTQDWININFNLNTSSRQDRFSINKTNKLKIGMNIISNRFNCLNGKIDLRLLNSSYQSYKVHCKKTLPSVMWMYNCVLWNNEILKLKLKLYSDPPIHHIQEPMELSWQNSTSYQKLHKDWHIATIYQAHNCWSTVWYSFNVWSCTLEYVSSKKIYNLI